MTNNKQQPQPENPNNQFSNTEPLTHAQRVAIANTMSNNKQPTHICVFEKSKTSNSNEAKCKHCNNVRYLIDVKLVKNETFGGNNEQQ